jgi:hypothetical protein
MHAALPSELCVDKTNTLRAVGGDTAATDLSINQSMRRSVLIRKENLGLCKQL